VRSLPSGSINGLLALVLPAVLVKRTSEDPSDTSPYYAFRMFGIRTVVLGADLLLLRGAALERARKEAVIIHFSDTVCAAIGGMRGDLPPRAARITVAISGGQHGPGRRGTPVREAGVARRCCPRRARSVPTSRRCGRCIHRPHP